MRLRCGRRRCRGRELGGQVLDGQGLGGGCHDQGAVSLGKGGRLFHGPCLGEIFGNGLEIERKKK